MVPVRAGDVVFIPPGAEYPHQFINTSTPMHYLSISTQEMPEIAVYPDSGKAQAYVCGFKLLQRPEWNLDHWDGAP